MGALSIFHHPIFVVVSTKIDHFLAYLNPLTASHPIAFFVLFAVFLLSGFNGLLFGDGKLSGIVGSVVLIALALLIGLSLIEEIEFLKTALHTLFSGRSDLLF